MFAVANSRFDDADAPTMMEEFEETWPEGDRGATPIGTRFGGDATLTGDDEDVDGK